MSKFSLILIFFAGTLSFSQNDKGLSKKRGMIIFEDSTDMYFVETGKLDLQSLLNGNNDTVGAYILYTTDGPYNFREYLSQQFNFDSILSNVKQENHLGQMYEDTAKLFWKYGVIKYVQSKSYKLERRYKTLSFGDRNLVITLENYLPIEMFTPSKKSKKKYSKSR